MRPHAYELRSDTYDVYSSQTAAERCSNLLFCTGGNVGKHHISHAFHQMSHFKGMARGSPAVHRQTDEIVCVTYF